MLKNTKFEKAARQRRLLALSTAVFLHLALFAALSYQTELHKLLPEFVKELFAQDQPVQQEPLVP